MNILRSHESTTRQLPFDILHLVTNYVIGRAIVFGNNLQGKLTNINSGSYVEATELNLNAADISFGDNFTLLLTTDGECYIRGDNRKNQLGLTDKEITELSIQYPTLKKGYIDTFINLSKIKHAILREGKIVKIATGLRHSLILTDDNQCYSFGNNSGEQLGTNDTKKRWHYLGSYIIDIGCGVNHSAYLTNDGQIVTFGDNMFGELGRQQLPGENIPKAIPGFHNIKRIFLSEHNTAFIAGEENLLYACGINTYNKLGTHDISFVPIPQLILDEFDQPMNNITKVCFGNNHMLILKEGHVYCCGSNNLDQLGLLDVQQIDKPRLLEQFVNQEITDIATDSISSLIVVDKICYITGMETTTVWKEGKGPIHYKKFTPLPIFTSEFIRSISSVSVRAGFESYGLLII
jgi:alpha-tubulin suppressor-like RCC1 family protein